MCFAGSVLAFSESNLSGGPANHPLSTSNSKNNLTSELNRNAFYRAMESNNKSLIDEQMSALNSAPVNLKNAFLGAMTMKSAGVAGNPFYKLWLFKKGYSLLEDAIKQDPNNIEFRFLRLMIQENAPGMLGYNANEEEDSEFIRKEFKSLPLDLQKNITDYNKTSKILKLQVS
jgi:hypothetical protein